MTETNAPNGSGLVLDASVAINLFASGEAPAILRAWPAPCLIERRTQAEVRVLRDREAIDPRAVARVIDWDSVRQPGLVDVVDLDDGDLHHFVTFAVNMDPGESAAGAYAVAHRLELAIDDRKARRVLEQHIGCRWSLDLVETWAIETGASNDRVAMALSSIRRYANWKPHTSHPLAAWWDAHMST